MSNNAEQNHEYIEVFAFIGEMAKVKYENEIRREESIIQQASQMQTAFSFITAALFMVAPIAIEYRGTVLSLSFFLVAFSSITAALVFSLFTATVAQNRKRNVTFPDTAKLYDYIVDNHEKFLTKSQREKYLIDTYAEVQKSKSEINGNRIKWLRLSMYSFYTSLLLCATWFFIAICKIL